MRGLVVVLLAVAAATDALALDAAEEYVIARGDMLNFNLVGANIQADLPVGIDGDVVVPLVGPVQANGRTLSDIVSEVKDKLARQSLPFAPQEAGRGAIEIPVNAVMLTIAEYRPVYVDGGVANPGAHAFRPGLTARQAVALAGGVGLAGPDAADRALMTVELRGDLRRIEAERAALLARERSLREALSLLSDATHGEGEQALPGPRTGAAADREKGAERPDGVFPDLETAVLEARRGATRRDLSYLAELEKESAERIATLQERLDIETQGLEVDAETFRELTELHDRGLTTADRLNNARRDLLVSSTRQLQTFAEISRSQRELDDRTFSIMAELAEDHAGLLDELRDVALELVRLDHAHASTREKLLRLGGLGAQGGEEDSLSITVVSTSGERRVGGDVVLRPADVVLVSLDLE